MKKLISIVTPCYNEIQNIKNCVDRVSSVMEKQLPQYEYEHIFCDNSSDDGSQQLLKKIASSNPRVKVVLNSKNIGPLRNIANGVKNSAGDFVVPMVPADMQDPPELIPELVSKMTAEVDVVYGIRSLRKENIFIRKMRDSYYVALKILGDKDLPPSHAGEFLLARRSIIDAVIPALDSYPYVRALVGKATNRTDSVTYVWGQREFGKSKNSFAALVDQAMSGVITTAKTPIRSALFFGIVMSCVGIIAGCLNFIYFLLGDRSVEPGIPTLIVGMFLFGGIQLFFIGLIGEYVVTIHTGVSPPPQMVEVEKINFEA